MKKYLYVLSALLFLSAAAYSQKITKPKQMPNPETAEQKMAVQQAVILHDAKKYDEAIAKYLAVLAENPDSTLALYELAMSYAATGDKEKAKETAFRGTRYISDDLPLFYGVIANALDDEGKTEEAIKIYRDAEDILKHYPELKSHLSSIYYNLAITYFRQKKYAESKAELKRAVENNFSYASPHYLLAVIYNGTKYRIPAFLAAARFASLEHNSPRTGSSIKIITDILKVAQKDPTTGKINIFLDLNAPKDEGDFGIFDLMLGTLTSVRGEDDKNKTDNEMFTDAIGTVIALLAEDKKIGSTFVGKQYVPFMVDMKKNGHVEAFGNMVLYVNNNNNADAAKWLDANKSKLVAFLDWAKAYRSPAR